MISNSTKEITRSNKKPSSLNTFNIAEGFRKGFTAWTNSPEHKKMVDGMKKIGAIRNKN